TNGFTTGSGSGGGGRVAIAYTDASSFDLRHVRATPGSEVNGIFGAVGTVYLAPSTGPSELLVDSHGQPTGAWTPLGVASDTSVSIPDLVLSGSVTSLPDHSKDLSAGTVVLQGGAVLTHLPTTPSHANSLRLTAGTLSVDAASRIDVTARGFTGGYSFPDVTETAS